MRKRLTTQEFIERANKVHNGKYDYSKVEYINATIKVYIICPTHGEFTQMPCSHLQGQGCPKCGVDKVISQKRFSVEDFINKANNTHHFKYEYSKVEYVNSDTKVCIICPEHGEFWQRPADHIRGIGCAKCSSSIRKKPCFGVGINDLEDACISSKAYREWYNMIARCYNKNRQETYKDCKVCNEWHLFSNFKRWFDEHYVEGWHLDKDILVKGNKVYSPQTCCFVPQAINSLITNRRNYRGKYLIGVTRSTSNKELFKVSISKQNRREFVGLYKTEEEAFNAYKNAKEEYIKEVANKWKDLIESKVYKALISYKVEIND